MILQKLMIRTLIVGSMTLFAHADSLAPFGIASAYNLVALGTVDSHGAALIAGTISTNSDVTGRMAAADRILVGTTVGSTLNSDPYGSLATFGFVSTNGLGAGQTFNMNGGGNAYAPGTNGNFNFNDSGHRVTSGDSGIDFNTLRTTLDAQSLYLATQATTGQALGLGQPGHNPSWYVLKGTSAALNIFTIDANVFGDGNHPIDIDAPLGSTILVNVTGTKPSLGTAIYYNGTQHSGDDATDDRILFNFSNATTLALNQGFSGSVLAPFAILSGTGQIDGNFIAAQIASTGEVHNEEFIGSLPTDPGGKLSPVPEPSTLMLMGTGILSLATAVRRKAPKR
jgi:choice-of-anchor A domain-containing protein